jgi:regulatory subunit for Cdc7p protein kinase
MAAVSFPPSPHNSNTAMTSRRVPLTNISNAANSPYRAVAAAAASKRSRSHSSVQRELQYGQCQPSTKKQMLDLDRPSQPRTPPRHQAIAQEDSRAPNPKRAPNNNNHPSTTFERRLLAARGKQTQARQVRAHPTPAENLETIRQWQKHYRKIFPQFVFYFESIPEDVRVRFAKQIALLGAVS